MTTRAAVLGSPISHSLSPALHRAAYDALGLPDWQYDACEVGVAELPALLDSLGPEWVGLSLTMPLKHVALELADEVSDLARQVGAVNTLTLRDGRRRGENTDVEGIVAALTAAGAGAGPAVVLGGGATAASALAALRQLGTDPPTVVVRSPERSAGLLEAAERLGGGVRLAGWDDAPRLCAGAAVVVSTVPAGVADPLADRLGPVAGVLLDVVYRPWPTALSAAWQRAGGVAVPGLEMLVHQAVAQVQAWSGRRPDPAPMRAAARIAAGWDPSPGV